MSYDHWKQTEPFNPDNESDDYERVHCDQCDELIIDGAPENERIGHGYYCPKCAGEKKAALAADVARDDFNERRR